MAATAPDATYDAMLDVIAQCDSVELQTSADAVLVTYALTAGAGNGSWVLANGDTSGRKLTMSALSGTNAAADGAGTKLVYKDAAVIRVTIDVDRDGDQTFNPINTNTGQEVQINAVDVLELADVVNET